MKFNKIILAGALASILSSYAAAGQQLPIDFVKKTRADHAADDINAGRLSYSHSCGWVDWGHAKGDGPAGLIKSVVGGKAAKLSLDDHVAVLNYSKEHGISLNKYTPIVYYQQMGKQVAGINIQVGMRSVYLVRKSLPKKTREGVAWRIFKEVSEQFERMQGAAPYGILPSTAASSFGIGDLTGDKISFYRALRGYSKAHLEKICKPYSTEKSLQQLERQRQSPQGQGKWRKLPALLSVPRIPRGIVLTVVKGEQFFGEYK